MTELQFENEIFIQRIKKHSRKRRAIKDKKSK
jgi:hypothetical protein